MCFFNLGLAIVTPNLHYSANNIRLVRSSDRIPDKLKEYFTEIHDVSLALAAIIVHSLGLAFAGYYCFVCYCMKLFFLEFVSKSKDLILLNDYQSVLQIYQELTETLTFANDFLAYPAFITMLCVMFGLFIFSYCFVFLPKDNLLIYVFTFAGVTLYLMALLPMMLSGACCNRAASQARDTVVSLPGWFPQHYRMLKMLIRQKFKKKYVLTLWKTHVIHESLLMSAFGTLITYGFLVGTIGIAQGIEAEKH
ncbi:uncharacterized protein TNIN_466201 [Trichonephila inaurata madagascariensis]|uniref:Uncharacterized protein n=1 Tax=Trichonephila inaurata madagascariensis TaxID=2747483 RepID=A0A8X6Y9M0_9ARAC|nr:uncharacterized protein TNIN_466201 [Trichonephila inaurata madagascariensis]